MIFPEGFAKIFHRQNVISADFFGSKVKMHGFFKLHRFFHRSHFLQHLFPALRTADGFFPVEGAEFFDDLLLVFYISLIIFIFLLLSFSQLFFFCGVIAVISAENSNFSVIDFYNFFCDAVQKITVMRDKKNGSLIGTEGRFQGVRMCFNVLLPMIIGPLITLIIGLSDVDTSAAGFTPPFKIFLAASIVAVLAFLPLYFVRKDSDRLRLTLSEKRENAAAETAQSEESAEIAGE